MVRTLKMCPIGCSETSVTNQQSISPNIPEVQMPLMAGCVLLDGFTDSNYYEGTWVTNQHSTSPNISEVQRHVMAGCVCWMALLILIITKELRICRYNMRIFQNEGVAIKVGSFVPIDTPAHPSGRNELANYCLYPSASNF
jgi:hypothetical protein